MQAQIHHLESNDFPKWSDFTEYQSQDPYDDYGWFHLTIGASGTDGANNFQVCVATPRAVGQIKRSGTVPGILVDTFDAESVRRAIEDRVASVKGDTWQQIVDRLRKFMLWEYEGMAG